MNQPRVTSSQAVIKAPTTLDKIPEDVQLAIIKFIQSWKSSDGSKQEREKGKRTRDSALRAVALSCRNLLHTYRPELLSDVTLNIRSLIHFYLGLARNQGSGKLVRSVTLTHRDIGLTPQESAEAEKDLSEIIKALRAQGMKFDPKNVFKSALEAILQSLPNLHTLLVLQPQFSLPLQSRSANGRLAPLPFLSLSLRKLFINTWRDGKSNLNARNVVWMLVFCTGLRSATFGCVFDQIDFKYLAEFSEAFSGSSKVQKLALGADFSSSERIQRYWDKGVGKEWIGGNRKSQAVFYLLKVTKNLQCLEVNSLPSASREGTNIISSFIPALQTSYLSLKSLRLFGMEFNSDDVEECKANSNYSLFQHLRVISLEPVMLLLWSTIPGIEFPPGLKVLRIPYYNNPTMHEDLELVRSFKVRAFPSLERVVVPSIPILRDGTVSDSEDFKKAWLEGRRKLEKAEIFQSGKVELRTVEPGESIGDSSETDFMSNLPWVSPP